MKKYIFLDLDGTITESAGAILSSAAYALKKLGIEDDDPEKKRAFIGPPLTVGFGELYGLSGETLIPMLDISRACPSISFQNIMSQLSSQSS